MSFINFVYLTQGKSLPLIHRACMYGELDTLTDLIEIKGIQPCVKDEVITLITATTGTFNASLNYI